AVQPAAEVGETVGGLDLDAELGQLAEDPDDLAGEGPSDTLQPLHRGGRFRIDLRGIGGGVAEGSELALDGEELRAQLADLLEALLQPRHQGIRLAQREDPYVLERIHRSNVHER